MKQYLVKPMMSDKEIEIIDKLLQQHKPKTCLEWGSGGSTVYFPFKHNFIHEWVAIEHNGFFVDDLRMRVAPSVKIFHVRLEEYLARAKGRKFDFILIDGLMRVECLMFAEDLLNPGGIIVLHDSGREQYQKPLREWSGKVTKLSEGEIEVKGYAHRGLHKLEK